MCLFAKAVKNDRDSTDIKILCSDALTMVTDDFFPSIERPL